MDNENASREKLIQEITFLRRRLAELDIRCSEMRSLMGGVHCCTMFDENPLMLFIVDEEGIVHSANQVGAAQLGYAPEELIGQSVLNVFHEEDRNAAREHMEESIHKPGKVAFWELRKVRKDGTVLWVKEFARTLSSKEGGTRIYIACEDITEHKRAEDQLKKAKGLSDALNQINTVIHSTLEFDAIMKKVVVEAPRAMEIDASSIGLFEGDEFVVRYGYNMPEELIGRKFPSSILKGISYAASVKEVVAFNDAYNDARLNIEMAKKYNIRSMIIAPFIIRGAVVGAMGFYCFSVPFTFPDIYIDFIRKLASSLSLALENARLYEERKRVEDEMRHIAHHDALTGLPNSRLFMDIASFELAKAHRNREKAAIMFLDLDRFKEINDTLGHRAGDELLKGVAERLKASIRESDTITRIGGDEFNVVLADIANDEDIAHIARKIMDAFREPYTVIGHEFLVTVSIGISVYPDDSEDMETLLRYADIAMYYVKEHGRNAYKFYNPAINMRSLERMRLESSLRQTLERSELTLYYQPQVDINTRQLICAEALVRWKHPELGLLEPGDFVHTAEDIGLAAAIDEWVLRTACAQAKAWMDARTRPVCITVNLSAGEFQNPDLVSKISHILEETGLSPEYLDIEVTESAAMSNIERTIANLNGLIKIGVRVSIDDFGTGYSSLNHLKRLPLSRLKIDKSFIRDIATDPDDRAIIRAVTAMAHSMKLRVLAEGVETEDQLSFLRSTHCDEAQGYFFSKPLPAEEFSELIAACT